MCTTKSEIMKKGGVQWVKFPHDPKKPSWCSLEGRIHIGEGGEGFNIGIINY